MLFVSGWRGEEFELQWRAPGWASTISDPPWVPQFQSLVTPYGMPIPCTCPLGPWFWEAFSFHFIALPLDPYLRPFIHSFSFHCLDHPLCHLDPVNFLQFNCQSSRSPEMLS